jgi:phytoene/squalene synthetase
VVEGLAAHVWPALGEDRNHLHAAIDAREGEVETVAPFPDTTALTAYLEACGAITLAALTLLGGHDAGLRAAARDVGVALAALRLLRALPADAQAGRLLLPTRRIEAEEVDVHALVRGDNTAGMAAIVGEVRELAETRLRGARKAVHRVDSQSLPAFLPAALAARRFARLRRAGDDAFGPALTRPAPFAPLTLLWHRLRRRY